MISLDLLKQVILDQKEELERSAKDFIERDVSYSKPRKFLSKSNIVLVTGVRRCGKSTYATKIFQEDFRYINFDDERLLDFQAKDFNKLLSVFSELYNEKLDCFVLDEIQNIKGWELFANRLRRTSKVVITGSNANLLSKEFATNLTGRYLEIILYPFSFREYLKHKGMDVIDISALSTRQEASLRKVCQNYIQEGGFPEAYKFGSEYCRTIFSGIVERDIIARYKIRAATTFKKIAHYLLSMHSKEISFSKIAKYFQVKDPHTVSNYFEYLEAAYLIFVLPRYSHKLKEQHLANKKSFAIDQGLINALSFNARDSIGKLYENVVFTELLRRRDYRQEISEIYFWQARDKRHEVDFVLRKANKIKSLIQVSYDISSPDTLERECAALEVGSKELGCKDLIIVTYEQEGVISYNGLKIKTVPLHKWLLS